MRILGEDVPMRAIISYASDYAIIIVLAIIFAILDAVQPFQQHFALQNYTLQYPYAVQERVPIWAAIIVAIGGPIVVIAMYTLVLDGFFSHSKDAGARRHAYTLPQRLWELNCGILGLFLASGTAFVITNILKNATGKPRPDFIARCLPEQGAIDPTPFGLSNSSICTQTDSAIMKDAFRSFPSGHSSSSFAGLFYLTLYLSGKLHLFDTRGYAWKTFLVAVPTLAAAVIAVSRIEDARHHPFDVLFGSALGVLCAYLAYRQYFPPLSEPWRKGRAYPMRTWGSPSSRWSDRDRDLAEGRPVRAKTQTELGVVATGRAGPSAAVSRSGVSPDGSPERPAQFAPRPDTDVEAVPALGAAQGRTAYASYRAPGAEHDWDDAGTDDERAALSVGPLENH